MEEDEALEFFETGKMEMILELLKRDTNAFFAPPATDHDLRECYDYLKALALPHDIPNGPVQKDHTYFLKRHNGFAWNDIEFFSADAEYEITPDRKLWDLYSMNTELYDINLDFADEWSHRYLCIGRAADSFFLWDDEEATWEVCDRKTGETTARYDNFYSFFVTEIGGRLKLAGGENKTPPYSAEKITETTEPGIVQHCKRFTETVVDVEYQEKYGKTKKEWFEDYKKENYVSTEDGMLAYLEAGDNYYARDDIPNAIEHYEKGIDILRKNLVVQAIDCELYYGTEGKLAVAFENMLRIYKTMGKKAKRKAASLIELFEYITFDFVDGIVKRQNFDLKGTKFAKIVGILRCNFMAGLLISTKTEKRLEKAKMLCGKGKHKKAVPLLQALATEGNAEAQNLLADCFYDGKGVAKDAAKAAEWWGKACAQGDTDGQYYFGWCCKYGEGVPQDYPKAIELLRIAAEKGHPRAQRHLGNCFSDGEGVEQDHVQAAEWWFKAAIQGERFAQGNMGFAFENGLGVPQDIFQAVNWYRKAAEQGNESAQYYLANCYRYGNGTEQNRKKAIEWFTKAAELGLTEAKEQLEQLAKEADEDEEANDDDGRYDAYV